jgi:hypothetical protein
MARAGGYVLHLPGDRRELFEEMFSSGEVFSQPVPEFFHARSAPLVCFVVSDRGSISHIARARRGVVAGSALRRLNLQEVHQLRWPVPISAIESALDSRTKNRTVRTLHGGGLFTPKSFESVIEALSAVSEEGKALLLRFSRSRRDLIARLSPAARNVLGQQKEAVASAMAIAGIARSELHEWVPSTDGQPASFLDGLPAAVMREDVMIVNDLHNVPGMEVVRSFPYSAAVFEGNGKRLTVLLANRLPLEQLTGTDLIYYNETHQSVVMVQYKAMEGNSGRAYFRLPNEQLEIELGRMNVIQRRLAQVQVADTKENYRLHSGPFYLKLCSRAVFNPDDIKLFPGMYFELDHWRRLASDPSLTGPQGGRMITYRNCIRYVDNDLFVRLVANGWIGCYVEHAAALSEAIRQTLESGKAVALAVEKAAGIEEGDAVNEIETEGAEERDRRARDDYRS